MEEEVKLPILDTITETYSALFQNWQAVLTNAILPIIFLIALSILQFEIFYSYLADYFADPNIAIWEKQLVNLGVGSILLVLYALLIPFATTASCFSAYILDYKNCLFSWSWGRHEFRLLRFVLVYLGITILFSVLGVTLTFLGVSTNFQISPSAGTILIPIFLIFTFVFLYIYLRICLVFPAAVFDVELKLKEIWKISKGHCMRIFWITFLGMIPIAIVTFAISIPVMDYATVKVQNTEDALKVSRQLIYYNAPLGGVFGWLQIVIWLNLLSTVFIKLNEKKAAQL